MNDLIKHFFLPHLFLYPKYASSYGPSVKEVPSISSVNESEVLINISKAQDNPMQVKLFYMRLEYTKLENLLIIIFLR